MLEINLWSDCWAGCELSMDVTKLQSLVTLLPLINFTHAHKIN